MAGMSRPSRRGSAASNWMTTAAAGAARGLKCPAGSLLEYIEGLWRKARGQGVES